MLPLPPPKQARKGNAFLEFLTDSPEQIAESIDRTGLRGKLEQAVQAAIARARGSQQNSVEPAVNEVREADIRDDAC
jgi:hypothetical protein